ncbi:MAG TPA: cytochrome c, partial [Gemmatimonadaceae bacterium]|nr:cytochrome c [Gemmatimonadaceae bacterium]
MSFAIKLGRAVAPFVLVGLPIAGPLLGQEDHPVQRVANIVSVAVEEYRKGVDEQGRLISRDEYDEAAGFLADARAASVRLSGDRAPARAILDSIIAAVGARRPPSALAALNQRFAIALGADAALELPKKPIDVVAGERLYQSQCASCHGTHG